MSLFSLQKDTLSHHSPTRAGLLGHSRVPRGIAEQTRGPQDRSDSGLGVGTHLGSMGLKSNLALLPASWVTLGQLAQPF